MSVAALQELQGYIGSRSPGTDGPPVLQGRRVAVTDNLDRSLKELDKLVEDQRLELRRRRYFVGPAETRRRRHVAALKAAAKRGRRPNVN